MAVELVCSVSDIFGAAIESRDLLEASTLETFTRRIEQAIQTGCRPYIPPIEHVQRQARSPLSPVQEECWQLQLDLLAKRSGNLLTVFGLHGSLDEDALNWALAQLVRRHEMLRTSFDQVDCHPVQVVRDRVDFAPTWTDLSDLDESRRELTLTTEVREVFERPFDLGEAPLLRVLVARVQSLVHVLALAAHPIIGDEWSLGIMVRDISRFYFHRVDGCPLLEDLNVQYIDYVYWQRTALTPEFISAYVSYWRNRLEKATSILPQSRLSLSRRLSGAAAETIIPKELGSSLARRALERNTTLFTILLAAFQLQLARYGRRSNVIVWTPSTGRAGHRDIELVVGPLGYLLPLCTDVSGNITYAELISRVRDVVLGAHAYQSVPFGEILRHLPPKMSNNLAIPDVVFEMTVSQQLGSTTPTLVPIEIDKDDVQFPLKLMIRDNKGTISVKFEYRKDLFAAAEIQDMLNDYEQLLSRICASPDALVPAIAS